MSKRLPQSCFLARLRPAARSTLLASLIIAWLGSAAESAAQTVQLPSFQTFSYSGTVVVPDRGGTSLGGRSSSSLGSRSRAGAAAMSSGQGISRASAHATIIDQQVMDQAVLGDAWDPSGARGAAAARGDRSQASAAQVQEGKRLVRFARSQFQQGNTRSAFEAYRLAIEILPGQLQVLATAEFRRFFPLAGLPVARGHRWSD